MNFKTDNEKEFLAQVKELKGFKNCKLPIKKCGFSDTCVILAEDEYFYESVRQVTRNVVHENQFKKPIDRFEIYDLNNILVIKFVNLEENRALCASVYPDGSYKD